VEELLAYGADHVICTEDTPVGPELSAKIMELTGGEGAWGAVDPVAGAMTAALSDGVRAGGKVLVYGALDGLAFTGSVVSTLFRGVQVNGYWVTPWLMGLPTAADRRAKMTEAMDLMASGVLVPHSGNTFALQDVQAAFAEANRPGRSSDGKVLLVTPAASMDTDLKEEA
jgi:NADPH:quinone reductase-like Zn-dependent oxidoreductase